MYQNNIIVNKVGINMENILNELSQISAKHPTLWFRGHSSIKYKLNSGLYRISADRSEVLGHENNIYNSFVNLGAMHIEHFRGNDDKDWNTLFMMQHYGMPTRLLDWTSSFITALYFANLGRNKDESAIIWALDPIALNNNCHRLYDATDDSDYDTIGYLTLDTLPSRIKKYTSYYNDSIHIKSFALMPRRSNQRLISQSGFFTVQGTDAIPLEEEYQQNIGDFLYKIELPPESYEDSLRYLKVNGVDYYSLFGGIDGLCKYIKDELLNIKFENI